MSDPAAELPGYKPYCPYTIDPGSSGQWTERDFETAERLVRRSGTAGTRVTFWYWRGASRSMKLTVRYVVNVLEELAFVADLRPTGPTLDDYYDAVFDSGQGIQIGPLVWFVDYPAASSVIATQLTCDSFQPGDPAHNLNASAFCRPEIDAMIERAVRIQTKTPVASGEAWAEVDREITDRAPWVSLVNPINADFVSERLGNYQYHPLFWLLLAQVWVR